ncbi:MAG: SusC/RagA family TonB-linked outer membrane protein [Sphingobacteriales bacterium]
MKKIYVLFSVLLLLSISNVLKAQNRTVSGTVIDEKSEPLPGVTVQVKGSSASTTTDVDGKFSIKVTNLQNVTIGVSFVGYNYLEKTLKVGEKNADFKMVPSSKSLDEVVIVGYGEQKKSSLTGSVATIAVKNIQDIPSLNLAASMAGQVVGLGVAQDARPGQPANITIRNTMTLNGNHGGSTAPLYIIDDQVRTQADFNLLDPSEVESISILKDAEAAIYGVQGANGAVLVRTKRGKIGAPKITFSSSFGQADAIQLPKMLSGIQFAQWSNDYLQISKQAPQGIQLPNSTIDANGYVDGALNNKVGGWYTPDELAYIANPANNPNYLAQEFKPADVEREAIGISGGNDKATYFIGANYVNQNSNFAGVNANKWGLRANVETKPAKGLTVSLGLNFEQSYNKTFWYKQHGTSENLNNDVITLNQMPPWEKYYIDGNPVNLSGSNGLDGINVNLFQNSDNVEDSRQYITNFLGKISYEIPGISGLTASVSFNSNINTNFPTQYGTTFNYYTYSGLGDNLHIPGGTIKKITPIDNGNDITFNPKYAKTYQLDATLNYQHSFGKNNISAIGIYEQQEGNGDGVNTSASYVIVGAPHNYNFTTGAATGAISVNQANSAVYESGLESYIARINYDYDHTYLVQFVGRRDGTPFFAPGRQWGNFGQLSLGWVASNAPFIKNALPWMEQLKFRASFGMLGTNNTNPTAFQYYQQYNVKTGSSGGAVFNEGELGNGIAPTSIPNPYTTWDHAFKTDYGVDMQFLKERLAITGDYFWNHNYDALTALSGSVPFVVGNTAPTENFGIYNTFGTELTVTWRDHISTNWGYHITAFYGWSDDKNIREDIDPGKVGTIQDRTGRSDDGGVFGLHSLGIIRTQDQADQIIAQRAAAAGGAGNVKILGLTPAPGMINYADLNGDGIVETDDYKDQKYLNHKSNNHNNVGFNFGFDYKSVSLYVVTGLSWGGMNVIPGNEITAYNSKDLSENRAAFWSDHWTPQNTNAKYPAPYYISNYDVTSDFWFVSSFNWNISQANLSYTIPAKWSKVIGVASARIYAQCSNVYSLFNPYPDNYRYPGSGVENYPTLRTFSIGLNAGF